MKELEINFNEEFTLDYRGEKITIFFSSNKGRVNSVKILIDAPKNISIHREEIYERIFGRNPFKEEK